MHRADIQQALIQTLERYHRSGVSRFARTELVDEQLQALAAWESASQTSQVAEPVAPGSSTPHPPAQNPPTPEPATLSGDQQNYSDAVIAASNAPTTVSRVSTEPPATQPGQWSLPVLEEPQRRAKFEALAAEVRDCRRCPNIVDYRRQTVFGDGHLSPTICFMGEAPGADEDRQGVPFVGRAGQLLTKIIAAMKLKREDVYILNSLKCRPPQNRTPVPEEIEACRGYVETQLETLQPRYLVLLGAVAARSILQSNASIGRMRGQFHSYRGARVVVTYHPSYLLRNESAKRLVWDDMKMLMRDLGVEL